MFACLFGSKESGRTSKAFRIAMQVAEAGDSTTTVAFLCFKSKLERSPPHLELLGFPPSLRKIIFHYVDSGRDVINFLANTHVKKPQPALIVIDDFDLIVGLSPNLHDQQKLPAHVCALATSIYRGPDNSSCIGPRCLIVDRQTLQVTRTDEVKYKPSRHILACKQWIGTWWFVDKLKGADDTLPVHDTSPKYGDGCVRFRIRDITSTVAPPNT